MIIGDDNLKEFRKIIKDVLTEYFADLDRLLTTTVKPFAARMYEHGIITLATRNSLNFDNIMSEFLGGMRFKRGDGLRLRCQVFLDCLVNQGGPLRDAACDIATTWTTEIEQKLDICITFDIN